MGTKRAEKAGKAAKNARKGSVPIAPQLEADLAEIVRAAPPPVPEPIPGPRRYTLHETREQVRKIEELMIEGARAPVIYRVLRGSGHETITRSRVGTLVSRITNDWLTLAKDDERMAKREAALRRLHRMRQVASGTRTTDGKGWLTPPNHSAVARYEQLIMTLEGSAEAIRVDVDVRYTNAMLEVVGSLTGEQAAEYLAEALQQRSDAELARKELPALVVEARARLTDQERSVEHDAEE